MGARQGLKLRKQPDAFLKSFTEDLDYLLVRVDRISKGQDKHIDINIAAYRQLKASINDAKVFASIGLQIEPNMEKTR